MTRANLLMRDARDRYSKMAGVIGDMTEQKKSNEEASVIRKTESVGVASSGLVHDFNNLLNIIYGNISYIKMVVDSASPIFEALTDAEDACERAKELSRRLLAFSQGSDPVNEPIVLKEIFENAAHLPASESIEDSYE